jgi:plastocyanin
MFLAGRVFQPLLVSLALGILCKKSSAQITAKSTPATTTSTASKTTSTGITTHTVQVGPKSNPHQYVPSNLTANVGDVVVFEFYPTNHSVVKADFGAPCVPAGGEIFWSGMFNTFNEQDGQLVGSVSEHR